MLATPEPRKRISELKRQIREYRSAIPVIERQIRRARKTEPDTPEIRAALDAASLKLAAAKDDLAAMQAELKTMGKGR
jgi:hypothetical protein